MAVPFDYMTIADKTAQIVSSYVAKNNTPPTELPGLIRAVADALASLGSEREATGKPQPAVEVQKSVSKRQLTCLLCGRQMKMLKRHLATTHKLAPAEYRQMFGLKADYPMSTPDYSAMRSQMARNIGLGRTTKPKQRGTKRSKSERKPATNRAAA